MIKLEAAVDKFVNLKLKDNSEYNYHLVVSHIFDIIHNIERLERQGVVKKTIEPLIQDVIEMIGGSPFFNRVQCWPRGYPGDFETIQYIMDSENTAKKDSIQYYIEQHGLLSPAAQQHRNKVFEQSHQILKAYINKGSDKLRVLSIGCGGNPDIRAAAYFLEPELVEFVLLDGDVDALAFSKEQLEKYSGSTTYIHGNIVRSLSRLKSHEFFQLVIAGGLFDYLQDKAIVKILSNIRENNLRDGGVIYFTNISPDNPDRVWMDYLVNWQLIARTRNDLIQLAVAAGFSEKGVKINKDATGLTYLVELIK